MLFHTSLSGSPWEELGTISDEKSNNNVPVLIKILYFILKFISRLAV